MLASLLKMVGVEDSMIGDYTISRGSLTMRRDVDLNQFVLTSGNESVLWLPAETARNLMHELARSLVDRCPCHRGQTFDNMNGRWDINR